MDFANELIYRNPQIKINMVIIHAPTSPLYNYFGTFYQFHTLFDQVSLIQKYLKLFLKAGKYYKVSQNKLALFLFNIVKIFQVSCGCLSYWYLLFLWYLDTRGIIIKDTNNDSEATPNDLFTANTADLEMYHTCTRKANGYNKPYIEIFYDIWIHLWVLNIFHS